MEPNIRFLLGRYLIFKVHPTATPKLQNSKTPALQKDVLLLSVGWGREKIGGDEVGDWEVSTWTKVTRQRDEVKEGQYFHVFVLPDLGEVAGL